MKMNYLFAFFLLVSSFLFSSSLQANRVRLFRTETDAQIYLTEHYNKGCEYYNKQDWRCAIDELEKVVYFFPNSEDAADAYYFLGVSFFQLGEYDLANESFSSYLKAPGQPIYFEDAVAYKFCIAEYFKAGQRRRLCKIRYLPKWATARTMALTIYDEVATAMPNNELAALALYSKGDLLQIMGDYRESIESYQLLIRRFPRHELTPQSYLKIAQAYCQVSCYELQNPDLIALAELNVRKFREDFPRDERVELAEGYVCRMKENYARGLSDMGRFYERTKRPSAAIIYYQNAIQEFPDTRIANYCRQRLACLGCEAEEDAEPVDDASADMQDIEDEGNAP